MFRFSLNRLLNRGHAQRTRPATVKHWPILEQLEDRTTPTFAAPVAYAVGDPGAIITADFNNDGRLDLANTNYASASVSVLLANGDGTFQAARHSPTDPLPGWLAAADFNGDGFLDLVTTHADSYLTSVNILLGQGDGTFQAPATYDLDDVYDAGAYNLTVAVGDVNADGSADVVTMWESSLDASILLRRTLLNNGDGTFSPLPIIQSEGYAFNPLNLADVDEDGRLDLIADCGLWKGNGDGTFTFVAFDVHGQVVADFNGDGHLDIASAGPEFSVEVRLGTGTGGFGSPQTYSTLHHQQNAHLAVGDFDADGHLDLLVRTDSNVTVLRGTGNGTFADALNFSAAGGGLAVADFNGDGHADFASNDWAAGEVLVFMNDRVWNLPTISIADVTVTEGNSGSVDAVFTVTLSAASTAQVSVHYATADGSATAGSDYQAASGTLTFAPGETSKTITIQVIGDRLAEPNETFVVNLSGATNATIADSQGVGTILDDEPRISISDVSKSEGKRGNTTLFTFTVTLSAAYDQDVTMSFKTVDGSAKTSDKDYKARTGTLTFKAGETTKTITIEVIGDNKKEANETFYLDLYGLSNNALFTKNRGIGTILNDD